MPPVAAQQLELGEVTTAATSDSKIASLSFNAPAAGVLTVVVRSTDESDLVLVVTDGDGQPLPEARSDRDLGGNSGAEQLAVTVPRAGEYQVRVEPFGSGSARFKIGASWISFPDLEIPPDPNGSPSTATAIREGQEPFDESLDGTAGDYWDWFVFTAERAGTLTVTTRAEDGDLVLEAFEAGSYTEALERSDQDLQGVSGNEALTLIVTAGQKVYFKVSAWNEGAQIAYRLQVGFMPD
jgi:hypothetical protein